MGAPETFDIGGFLSLIKELRSEMMVKYLYLIDRLTRLLKMLRSFQESKITCGLREIIYYLIENFERSV